MDAILHFKPYTHRFASIKKKVGLWIQILGNLKNCCCFFLSPPHSNEQPITLGNIYFEQLGCSCTTRSRVLLDFMILWLFSCIFFIFAVVKNEIFSGIKCNKKYLVTAFVGNATY